MLQLFIRYCTTIMLFFFAHNALAQKDSLEQDYIKRINAANTDTGRISLMINYGIAITQSAPDTAIIVFNNALQKSRKINYQYGEMKSLLAIGLPLMNKGRYEEAIAAYNKSLLLCKDHSISLAIIYNNLGNAYRYMGDYHKSMEYYYVALKQTENNPQQEILYGRICNNLSAILMDLNEPAKAIIYQEKAEKTFRKNNNNNLLAKLLNNKGSALLLLNNKDKGTEAFKEAILLSKQYHDPETQSLALQNLGDVYKKTPLKAISYLEEAATLSEGINPHVYTTALIGLSNIYTDLNNPSQAEHYLLMVQAITKKNNLPEINMQVSRELSALYGTLKDYQKAWNYQVVYSNLKDSLMGEDKIHSINQLETKYRTAQKDKEIAQKQAEIVRKNAWIWASVSGLLLLSIISMLLYRNYRHKKHLHDEKVRALEQQDEIKLLKAIMQGEEQERIRIGRELHDGVGGLLSAAKINFSTIRDNNIDTDTQDFSNALRLVDIANDELRKTAHNLMPEILLKGGLSEAISNFCTLVTQGQDLHIHVDNYGPVRRLHLGFELSVYRIVQELVHNVVKHAQAKQTIIQLNWNEKSLNITIEDDGIGMPQELVDKGTGIGLKNIQARTRALEGYMELESNPQTGTTICLEFTIEKLEN